MGIGRAGGLLAVVATLLALGGCAGTPAPEQQQFPRASMGEIAEALTLALPLSASQERLDTPAARETFETSLRTLSLHAGRLKSHGRVRDDGFGYLSRTLADDARDALRRYERGERAESQFIVLQLVDDCVACHSRLPGPESKELGARLLRNVNLSELEPAEQARIETATRQFDLAIESYELMFLSASTPPGKLDLEGLLVDYLVLCIRVKEDLRRPQLPLERLALRPDVPSYLERDLRTWILALEELDRRPLAGPLLPRARALVQEADLRNRSVFDRKGLVHALRASGLLHRFVSAGDATPEQRAEAYYLLGLTETRIQHSYWLSEAEFYLETAIRTAPDTVFAELAYDLLELETLAGYTGTEGVHLPEDVQRRLEELRALIDAP